jgi:hypothetical protein
MCTEVAVHAMPMTIGCQETHQAQSQRVVRRRYQDHVSDHAFWIARSRDDPVSACVTAHES